MIVRKAFMVKYLRENICRKRHLEKGFKESVFAEKYLWKKCLHEMIVEAMSKKMQETELEKFESKWRYLDENI